MGEGKRGSSSLPKGERESSAGHEGKKEKTGRDYCDPIPLGNHNARTHARTKQNDFPVELTPPTSNFYYLVILKESPNNKVWKLIFSMPQKR